MYERAEGDIEPLPHARRLLRTSIRSTPGRRSCNTVAREYRDPRRPTAPGSNDGRIARFCSPGTACSKLAVHRRLCEQNCCERGPRKYVKPIFICIQTCTLPDHLQTSLQPWLTLALLFSVSFLSCLKASSRLAVIISQAKKRQVYCG